MNDNKFGFLMTAAAIGGIAISMLLNAYDLLPSSYIWTIPAILIAVVFAYRGMSGEK